MQAEEVTQAKEVQETDIMEVEYHPGGLCRPTVQVSLGEYLRTHRISSSP